MLCDWCRAPAACAAAAAFPGARAAGREQADSGTEAALAAGSPGSTDDAAVGILERLGFPRARHRTQARPALAGRWRREPGVLFIFQSAAFWPACLHVLRRVRGVSVGALAGVSVCTERLGRFWGFTTCELAGALR
jgi:hypothetical protein